MEQLVIYIKTDNEIQDSDKLGLEDAIRDYLQGLDLGIILISTD